MAEYELLAQLGAGGTGRVFRARHRTSGAEHALKLLEVVHPDEAWRFQREVEALARVDAHPNLVRIHGAGVDGGRPYLVMELAAQGDLRRRLERGPLPPGEAVRIVVALARGLAHVHARGVLHRDVKPGNVLFDERNTPKLADFGLAFLRGQESLTRSGAVLGTPSYMSPEQILADAPVDQRCDVYGLGAVLFHALSGQPPFRGTSPLETLQQVLNLPPRSIRSLVPAVPAGLDAICKQALAKRPERRYPSADALAAALEEALRASGPPGRSRWIVLLCLGLVAVFAVVYLSMYGDASDSRAEGQESREVRARSGATAAQELITEQSRILEELTSPMADWAEQGELLERQATTALASIATAASGTPLAVRLEIERRATRGAPATWSRRLMSEAGRDSAGSLGQLGRRCRAAFSQDQAALEALDGALKQEIAILVEEARKREGSLLAVLNLETLRTDLLGLPLRTDPGEWIFTIKHDAPSSEEVAIRRFWELRTGRASVPDPLRTLDPMWARTCPPSRLLSIAALLRVLHVQGPPSAALEHARLALAPSYDDLLPGGPVLAEVLVARLGKCVLESLLLLEPPDASFQAARADLARIELQRAEAMDWTAARYLVDPAARLLACESASEGIDAARQFAGRLRIEQADPGLRVDMLSLFAELSLGTGEPERVDEAEAALNEAGSTEGLVEFAARRLHLLRCILHCARGEVAAAGRQLELAPGGARLSASDLWWTYGSLYMEARLAMARNQGAMARQECLSELRGYLPRFENEPDDVKHRLLRRLVDRAGG